MKHIGSFIGINHGLQPKYVRAFENRNVELELEVLFTFEEEWHNSMYVFFV